MSFQFKQFLIKQTNCAQKVSEVACIQGAWTSLPSHIVHVLDIGSGTGLLSLMIAQRYDVKIDAIELEEDCFKQGKENIEASIFRDRINPIHGDLNEFNPLYKYDFIISNPPFFEGQLKADTTSKNLAKHSSQLSLQTLIVKVDELLNEYGECCFLFPADRKEEVIRMCRSFNLFHYKSLLLKHSLLHSPKVVILHFSRQQKEILDEDFIIKENGVYTSRMRELMEEYYLKMADR